MTITISDEIEASLNAYVQQQKVAPRLTATILAALQDIYSTEDSLPRQENYASPRDIRSNAIV